MVSSNVAVFALNRAIFNLLYGVTSFRGLLVQTNPQGYRTTLKFVLDAPNSNKGKSCLPLTANEVIDTFS